MVAVVVVTVGMIVTEIGTGTVTGDMVAAVVAIVGDETLAG